MGDGKLGNDDTGNARTVSRSTNAGFAAGILTMNGDAQGTTAGMGWNFGAQYGRWEVRMRAPAADPSYHAVALVWPDAENWPGGGEVDFAGERDIAVARGQLVRLAAAHEKTRIGPLAPPGKRRHRHRTGGDGQLGELLQVLRIHGGAQSQAHQYGTLTGPWALEH